MRLLLDNNILFSLFNHKSTSSYLFSSIRAEFLAPEYIKSELEEHREECLIKSKLSEQQFEMREKEIEESIKFLELAEYKKFLKKALNSIPQDSDDSPYIAAALSTKSAIWSDDFHLKQQSLVKVFTTSELVKLFL